MWALVQFVVANAAALLIANGVAGILFSGGHQSRRVLATLAGYQVLVTLVTLLLGVLGKLHAFWIPTLVLTLASVPFVLSSFAGSHHRHADFQAGRRDWAASPPFLCVLLALLVVWTIRHGMLGGLLSVDDQAHHALRVAQWYQDGGIAFHYFNYQSYYPANAELFTLWFALPFGNDALTPLVGIVYVFILVALCFDCGYLLRLPIAAAAIAAGLLLSTKKLSLHALSFCDVDLGVAAMSCAAVVLALPARRDYALNNLSVRHACALVCLIGAVAGSALGMTSLGWPLALLAMVITLWHLGQASSLGTLTTMALFLTAAAIAGGYWYARNLIIAGNPFYPFEIGPLTGPLTTDDPGASNLIHAFSQASPTSQGRFLLRFMDWSYVHLLCCLLGYGAAILMLVKRHTCDRLHRDVVAAVLSIGVINLALYPLNPFIGYDQRMALETSGTSLFAGYTAGGILFAIAVAPWVRGLGVVSKRLTIALLWFVVVVYSLYDIRATLAYLFIPAVLLIMVGWIVLKRSELEWFRASLARWVTVWGYQLKLYASVIVFVEFAAFYPLSLARQSDAALKSWAALQSKRLPVGSTVSIYDGRYDRFVAFELFGRSWQHRVVRLLDDGRAAAPLHTRERPENVSFWNFERGRVKALPDAKIFVEHLRRAGVNYLFTTRNPNSAEPETAQARLLQESGLLGIYAQSAHGTIWIVDALPETPGTEVGEQLAGKG